MIEKILYKNKLLAIIIRTNFSQEGISFFTPDDFSQQLAYMNRNSGYIIEPHVHNPVARTVDLTQEVLFIRKGKVRVDFYSDDKDYIESRELHEHDVILLAHGGHGFKMLEDSEIIEVKQGPYAGDRDKTRFSGIDDEMVSIKK